jgi:hypothetical protein
MKKRLHPQLTTRSYSDSGNGEYSGGTFNFFGIELEIAWDPREESWELSCPHLVDDSEIIKSLKAFEKSLSKESVETVFGGERQVRFVDLGEGQENFWSEDGAKWMVGKASYSHLEPLIGYNICIRVSGLNDLPTGEVRHFENETFVYIYPEDNE